MSSFRRLALNLAPALVLLLCCNACGGGGGSTAAPVPPVPAPLQPPAALSYLFNPVTLTVGTVLVPNTPSSSGGAVAGYTVSPALPPGLALASDTGVVTGTPTAVAAQSDYIVTASNAAGGTPATLTITVQAAAPAPAPVPAPNQAPAGLVYTQNSVSYANGAAILPNLPLNWGGAITGYTVSPARPCRPGWPWMPTPA